MIARKEKKMTKVKKHHLKGTVKKVEEKAKKERRKMMMKIIERCGLSIKMQIPNEPGN